MKSIMTRFAPELNPSCIYFLDCLRPPVVCAQCRLKGDPFIDMSVQRALHNQSRLILNGEIKSDFYKRMKAYTTAKAEYVLPIDVHKVIQKTVIAIKKQGEGVIS